MEIDTTQVTTSRVIELLGLDNIKDINISNIPLETIISDIYRKEQAK